MKENNKKKIFIVNYEIYPFDCLVCIGSTTEEIVKYLKKLDRELSKEEIEAIELENIGRGRTIMLESGQTIIRLNSLDASTLAHEVFHAVYFLAERLNIKLSEDSDEAFAYLIEFLTKKIILNFYKK